MPDYMDDSVEEQNETLKRHIDAARHIVLDGPVKCLKCGETNDRRKEGFALCSSCAEMIE